MNNHRFLDTEMDDITWTTEDGEDEFIYGGDGGNEVDDNDQDEPGGDDDAAEDMEEGEQSKPDGNQPLYAGAMITLMESMLLILTYSMKHQLTGVALADLLVLISVHCLAPNLCKTTLYLFKKFFKDVRKPLTFHKFCSKCSYLLNEQVECPICHEHLSERGSISYFIEIPILAQLQDMFLRANFLRRFAT